MSDKPPKVKRIRIKEGEHEMDIFIPQSGDRGYDQYLEEAERGKTSKQLKSRPPKPKPTKSDKEIGEMLREYSEFKRRQRRDEIKKYY